MKRIRTVSLVLVFCMLLSLTACGGRTDVGEGDSYIYGLNTERTGLVKAPSISLRRYGGSRPRKCSRS